MPGLSRLRLTLILLLSTFVAPVTYAAPLPTLTSSEHLSAGEAVKLTFNAHVSPEPNAQLHLPNGLVLGYGEIVTLADFYEIPGKSIMEADTEIERRARFLQAFDSFTKHEYSISETKAILDVIHKEQRAVLDGMAEGKKPEDIYKVVSPDDNRQWNCITGGGCSALWYLDMGRYLILSKQDYDHFGESAWQAYQVGHKLAMERAIFASQHKDRASMELAYAMNAFASHYLTDRFSSGHLRVPRQELSKNVSPALAGSLLVNYMHNEEDQFGLHVHNGRGDRWMMQGDRYFFDTVNSQSRVILTQALQRSADQVYSAAALGSLQSDDAVQELIPVADFSKDEQGQDIAPLFYWDPKEKKIFRRLDMTNEYDFRWTSSWWGWSTLMLLSEQRGLPEDAQGFLALSSSSQQAVNSGLIKDKRLIQYVHQKARHA